MKIIFRLNEIRDSTVIHLKFFSLEFENFTKRDSDEFVSIFIFLIQQENKIFPLLVGFRRQ
jgi:hypothetical protein